MDRCGVFVDAGYLFAEGGKLCCGTRSRKGLLLDAAAFVDTICRIAAEGCGLNVLRTYWYDGAKGGVATTAQQLIAGLPNVKLRLGRLNAQMQQKGVDALIYRDLMTLAREHAISDAYLLSGDEDLREGVRSAQDMGVRVTLIGIAPTGQDFNQSRDLVHEADELVVLGTTEIGTFFRRRRAPAVTSAVSSGDPLSETRLAAADFAKRWVANATSADLAGLVASKPRIPKLLDSDLIEAVEDQLGGSLRGHDPLRRAARRVLWDGVPATSPGSPAANQASV
jgi:uncharacterized LabA/DUF88 family protein